MYIPKFRELFDRVKATLLLYGHDITASMVDTTGTHVNIIAGTIAGIADYLSHLLADGLKQSFVTTATGGDLDRLAFGWYGLTRKSATPSTATVTFSRTDTAADLDIPAGTVLLGGDYKFDTDYDLTIPAGVSSALMTVTCEEAGYATNVGSGIISSLETPITGVSVTNPNAAAGGTEDETDEEFRNRIQGFWLIAQRGTLAAIEYGAKQVPGITYSKASEIDDGECATVTLYIADQNGQATSTMLQQVTEEERAWKPAGVHVNVIAAVPYMISIKMTISVGPGYDIPTAIVDAKNAALAYVNTLGLGDTFVPSDLGSYVVSHVTAIATCSVTDPAAAITPSSDELVRTTYNDIQVS